MKRTHAQIHLPHLEAHDALRLVQWLEGAITAIWRAHGHEMSEILINRHCDDLAAESAEEQADLPF